MDYNFQPKGHRSEYGWHSRGYLPHFDGGGTTQFITFRLFDSLPQTLLEQWRRENRDDAAFRKRIEIYLDSGHGSAWLGDERIAVVVRNALLYHDSEKYRLTAWVVMPNHVHLLLTPLENQTLTEILHSIKSYTAHQANKILNRSGIFWQHESFDRYIRNRKHFLNVIEYIENNPVAANLCQTPELYQFSSAFFKT
jgi:REP element-mobilizing transposase RayT